MKKERGKEEKNKGDEDDSGGRSTAPQPRMNLEELLGGGSWPLGMRSDEKRRGDKKGK